MLIPPANKIFKVRIKFYLVTIITFAAVNVFAQSNKILPPALSEIKESDLKKDLYAMASDNFRGREAGTLDELKDAVWWAGQLRMAGVKPAGDDGTYFQFFSLLRNRVAANSSINIGDHSLLLWKDVLVAQTAPANVSVPIVFAGSGTSAELDNAAIKDKAVAIMASPEGVNLNLSVSDRRYPTLLLNKFRNELTGRGAAAIIFIADSIGERSWNQVVPAMSRGLYDIEGGPNAVTNTKIPVLWLHAKDVDWVKNEGATLNAVINVEHFEYPSVNIVGKIELLLF